MTLKNKSAGNYPINTFSAFFKKPYWSETKTRKSNVFLKIKSRMALFFNLHVKLKKSSSLKISTILTSLMLAYPSILNAQEINGKVIDSAAQSLEFVNVTAFINNKAQQTTLTDKSGLFNLKNLEKSILYRIRISAIGYKSVDTLINTATSKLLEIKLTLNEIQLKEVTVNTSKISIERKIDRTIVNVRNTFSELRGDALDVLGATPGLSVDGNKVSIVGKGTVSLMVNDRIMKIQEEDLMSYLKTIPSNSIETIEIITTPPSKYSAEGNSGLINIRLKKLPPDYWSVTLRPIVTQRTYTTGSFGGIYDYRKKTLQISSSISYSDGSSSAVERPLISYPDQFWSSMTERRDYTKSYNGRLFAELSASKRLILGIQAYYGKGRPFSKDSTNSLISDKISKSLIETLRGHGISSTQSENMSFNVNATYSFGRRDGKISYDIDYYINNRNSERIFNSEKKILNQSAVQDIFSSNNQAENNFKNFSHTLDFYQPLQKLSLNYGINFFHSVNRNDLNAKAIENAITIFKNDDVFKFTENTAALYGSVNFKMSNKLEFQGGLRMESTSTVGRSELTGKAITNNYFKVFPSSYLSYQPNDKNTVSLNYSRRIERPSYTSLNPFRRYINQFYYSVGNPFLLPAFIDNVELNYINNGNFTATLYGSFSREQIAQTAIPNSASKLVIDSIQNFFNSKVGGLRVAYVINQVKNFESINVVNSLYRTITQKDNSQAPNYKGYAFTYNIDNSYKIGKRYYIQMGFFYYSPQYLGIYRQSSRSGFSTGFRFKHSDKLEAGLLVYDLFKSSQAKLTTSAQGSAQEYINFYDNRYFRLNIQYKIGSTKLGSRQRNLKNESEKQRVN